MLCGVVLTTGGTITAGTPNTFSGGTARLLVTGISGLGATRKAVDNVHNSLVANWIDVLYSCLAKLKPFRVSTVTDTNSAAWVADIQAAPTGIQITWPAEPAYSTGGALFFPGAVTDVDFGAADIESRVEGSFTITPKGQPTVAPGTHS